MEFNKTVISSRKHHRPVFALIAIRPDIFKKTYTFLMKAICIYKKFWTPLSKSRNHSVRRTLIKEQTIQGFAKIMRHVRSPASTSHHWQWPTSSRKEESKPRLKQRRLPEFNRNAIEAAKGVKLWQRFKISINKNKMTYNRVMRLAV